MRISLITEGTYPTAQGGVSVWCDQLVKGMAEHRFAVHAIVGTGVEPEVWPRRPNVQSVTHHALWGPQTPASHRRGDRRRVREAYAALLDAVFLPDPAALDDFAGALRALDGCARRGGLTSGITAPDTIRLMLDHWRRQPVPGRPMRDGDAIPAATVDDAVRVTRLFEHFLRPLGTETGDADLVHAVSNGLSGLIALSAKWRHSTPFLLTEHGIYLRERHIEYRANGAPFAVRATVLRFFALLTTVTYRAADIIAPASDYNSRWQVRHGAANAEITRIYNGIEPDKFLPSPEPEQPTVSWIGRITPIKDLETLLTAFRLIHEQLPDARLRVFGSAPAGDEEYLARCRTLATRLGLDGRVTFEGRARAAVDAYRAGQVVALSSTSEGFPYTVLEAMATGRATVSTDVGGVREAVGPTGVVVPPRDPAALADGCVRLLGDTRLRQRMAAHARRRVRRRFTVTEFLQAYRLLYRILVPDR